jgi:predicted HAD superfamily Cof-like phosphohydrolase
LELEKIMITREDIEAFADSHAYWSEDKEEQSTPLEMVKEYHETSGLPVENHVFPQYAINAETDEGALELRETLIKEEVEELLSAPIKENALKELADLVYVAYGYAVTFGWDLDEALRRVHKNNMGRMYQPDGSIKRRKDGKIEKNKDYPKVDLGDLV